MNMPLRDVPLYVSLFFDPAASSNLSLFLDFYHFEYIVSWSFHS